MPMARPLRIEYAGAVYHATARGNERRAIFRDAKDCEKFLAGLGDICQRFDVVIHGYVLMRNHYHLLMETPRPNLARAMHYLNATYTGYFNRRHRRIGHLLQGRYKAFLIEKDRYLLAVSRYIHLNPVRAGITDKPEGYQWSSYPEYIGRSKKRGWLACEWILGQYAKQRTEARRLYRTFVEEGIGASGNPFQRLAGGLILGSESFVEEIKEKVSVERHHDIPETKFLTDSVSCEDIIAAVAERFGVNEREITGGGTRNNRARRICFYLARRLTQMSNGEIGERFGVGYSAVSKAYLSIRRDLQGDRKLRTAVKDLEQALAPRIS